MLDAEGGELFDLDLQELPAAPVEAAESATTGGRFCSCSSGL
jgi:hypothetical protein